MIPFLMKITGLSKVLVISSLVALAFVGLGVAKCSYDRSVIRAHDAGIEAKVERTARSASEAATTNQEIAADEFEAAQQNATQEIDNAIQSDSSPLDALFNRMR